MAAFFSTQLDFIFFFYGLAFILLGATCFSIARSGARAEPWIVLGAFAYIHGAGEWLDLFALIVGDTAAFAAMRIALMTGSYLFLMEFARLEAIRFGTRLPGRWVYLPLALSVVLGGAMGGPSGAGAVARYAVGLSGALAASWTFARHAEALSGGARRFAIFAAVGFALYGVAAGAIVRAAPFWPASVVNYDWFAGLTGTPIQLVRGLLACWIAFSIWSIRQHQLALEVSSELYTAYLRKQFAWTVAAMAAILLSGWMLTDFLGGIYKQTVQAEARSDLDLLSSRLAGETGAVEGMVKTLAGSPSILPFLVGGSRQSDERAQSVLDLHVEASGAGLGLVLDLSGTVVASSTRRDGAAPSSADYRSHSYFQAAVAGGAGHQFAFDAASRRLDYSASYPVRDNRGKIIGVAVLTKSFASFEADLGQFDRPYFFIDPDGVVAMTNRPNLLLRTMWPLSAERMSELTRRFGTLDGRPMSKREIVDATWLTVDGERDYARRSLAPHSRWSLVILTPSREIFASRVLGIVVTLLVTLMTLIYLIGKERWLHDSVQMDKRLRLQQLARDLGQQAITDPLTGLFNRLKFDQALAGEMLRAGRYKTPLSLVLYDVDNFKTINDTYGHQIGDKALVRLSQVVPGLIRSSDLLARWGGEEFVLLTPGSDARMASQAAEKLREAIGQIELEEIGKVTCSFGVTQFVDGDTAEAFISRADGALYNAKINGRNRVEVALKPVSTKTGLVA